MSAAGDAVLLARVTVSLIVVVLLALLGARLARRTGLRGPGRGLRLLERLPLSREAFLAVVAVADRGLVVGVTAHGVQVVGELDAETVARVYPEPAGEGGGPGRRGPGRGPGGGRGRGLGRGPGRGSGGGVGGGSGGGLGGGSGRGSGSGPGAGGRPLLRLPANGRRTDDVAGVEVGPDGVKVTRLGEDTRTPPAQSTGTGSVLDPRTWRQAVDALRDLTVRRG